MTVKSKRAATQTDAEIKRRLRAMAEFYGHVPFISQALSETPDLFLPYTDFSHRMLVEPKHLSLKELELAAVAAGSALGSEHCLGVHIPQALKVGATREAITEAIMVGAFMAMTKGQSIGLRKLAEQE